MIKHIVTFVIMISVYFAGQIVFNADVETKATYACNRKR